MDPALTPAAARQRWRIAFRRRADAPALPQRESIAAWEEGLAASGLPLATADRGAGRPRLSFGAPLGVGIPAERELVDLFLAEPRRIDEVRATLARCLPEGHELVDLHDVWVGAPPLPASVVGLVYRVDVSRADGDALDPRALAEGAERLLGRSAIPRRRAKGAGTVSYDLRPLLAGIETLGDVGTPAIRIRVRVDPERGIGRPEEVVAALGDEIGVVLEGRGVVRERVETADEPPAGTAWSLGRR
jgi:radical SAM-linked protein